VVARRAFRIGPVLLFPFVILWGEACYRIGLGEDYAWWRVYPILGALVAAGTWHLALLIVEKDRFHYSMYAVAHLPFFLFAAFTSYLRATRAPL